MLQVAISPRVSSQQFLLRPDDGCFMGRNQLPIKRVFSDLLGLTVELNKIYTVKLGYNVMKGTEYFVSL
jgi:hypothetical protein